MAYTNVWDDTLPSGSEAANTIDDIFRGLKVDIEERLEDIFGTMPAFTTDPLRPYGLKFTDAQDAVITLGDNAGTPRAISIKDKTAATTYIQLKYTGIVLTPPTITASTPFINVTQTWNNAGVTFNAILVNITSTASNAGSTFINLQLAGSSKFSIDKSGNVVMAGSATISGVAVITSSASSLQLTVNSGFIFNVNNSVAATTALTLLSTKEAQFNGSVTLMANASLFNITDHLGAQRVAIQAHSTIYGIIIGGATGSGSGVAPFIFRQAAGALDAGAAAQNGRISIDDTNNRFVWYSSGNRYYVNGTIF